MKICESFENGMPRFSASSVAVLHACSAISTSISFTRELSIVDGFRINLGTPASPELKDGDVIQTTEQPDLAAIMQKLRVRNREELRAALPPGAVLVGLGYVGLRLAPGETGLGLDVHFMMRNPNRDPILVEGLEYDLTINGRRVARGYYPDVVALDAVTRGLASSVSFDATNLRAGTTLRQFQVQGLPHLPRAAGLGGAVAVREALLERVDRRGRAPA